MSQLLTMGRRKSQATCATAGGRPVDLRRHESFPGTVLGESGASRYLATAFAFDLRMARALAFRFTSDGFSYRSRRLISRFRPVRSTSFRNRRTAS